MRLFYQMSTGKKILLLHLHSNGDCLYATAIARQIKHDHPGCRLTWVVATWAKSVLENNPYIDEIVEVPDVNKNTNTRIHREQLRAALAKKAAGEYDEVFSTQLIDDNIAYYDGTIRSGILRAYGRPITQGVQPVLRLREAEIATTAAFAERHKLAEYRNVILFEFAPQSGQLAITTDMALNIARQIVENPGTCIILSSANRIDAGDARIIDGSVLTLRETAALSHYCTLLIGCSSGISWITTSDAGKMLPMLQILDAYMPWVNPITRDFERCGMPDDEVLEIYDNDPAFIVRCAGEILNGDIREVKKKYQKPLPLHFIGTSRNIYNMLCFLQFGAIAKHIRINVSVWGWHPLLVRAIVWGFVSAPFKLVRNVVVKRVLKK
ncbi:hypothetical protein GCM10023093_15100 [Nemorincola caseinilytica]|uniref:Glycosyltransferase family 9 protein n=1 Tax=Nemorincola caseinilytica TaxID=2054315 RepID=A0ABP8NFG0_9BACT